ncbi:MAG: hypothetical protein ACR2FV_07330 [Ornithinimicrobium sp.]|uniref:hypothetical protein n=1 Tax=Ornithinimicrobium sp. TaxID=1977084 RepID=UPI00180C7155|nr:hypothetical protein [Actinomycetota bacterium]
MSENPGPEDLEQPDQGQEGTPGPDTGPGAPSSDKGGRSGQVSEAGGTTLNEETAEGGADAVPDAHG